MLPKDGVFLSLLFAFLLLPFAQVKVSLWGLPLYLPEIAILVASFFFFWRFFTHSQSEDQHALPDRWILFGSGLFFAGASLSFMVNPTSLTGLGMVKSWFFFPLLGAGLLFFEAQNREKRRWFVLAWFTALVVTALGSLLFVIFGALTYDARLSGMYASPNFLAVFLAPGVFLMFDILFSREGNERLSPFFRGAIISGGLCLIASIYYTRSYGVWVALLLALLFFFMVEWRFFAVRRGRMLLFGILLIAISSFFFFDSGSEKWQALTSLEERSSLSSRFMIWRVAERAVQEHWLFGIGPGRFQAVYLDYQRFFPPYLEWAVPEPHNVYVAVPLSTGMIGLLGFFVLIFRFLFLGWRLLVQAEEKEKRLSALVFLSLMVLFLLYGLVDTPYFKNDLALSFWFLVALGLSVFFTQASYEKKA